MALYLIVDWRLSFFFPLDMFFLAAAVGVKGYMAFRVSVCLSLGYCQRDAADSHGKVYIGDILYIFLDLLSINQFRSRIELPTPSKKKEKPRKEKQANKRDRRKRDGPASENPISNFVIQQQHNSPCTADEQGTGFASIASTRQTV